MEDKDKIQDIDSNSLETPDTSIDTGVVKAPEGGNATSAKVKSGEVNAGIGNPLKHFFSSINIYFILLVVLLILLGIGAYIGFQKNNKASHETDLKTQSLTQADLDKLSGADSTVGDAKQTLTVESNAIFSGGIVVHGNLDIVGTLKLGSALSLPGINVGGTATLEQASLKTLTVSGDSTILGKLTLQNNLSVNGSASFNGTVSAPQITVDTLQLSKDLQLSHHLIANGATPTRSQGSALGSGGTATVSGSDTAGTVTINTGGSAPSGCFITVNFTNAFAKTPKVVISPASSTAATIDYYVNRNTTSFSVCTATDPPDNIANIVFDYIIAG